MLGFTRDMMWSAVMRLADVSRSVASDNQRIQHEAYQRDKQVGMVKAESRHPDASPPEGIISQPAQDDGTAGGIKNHRT